VERAEELLASDRQAIRDRETKRGHQAMRRRLRDIARFYERNHLELEDLKLIFDPVDYVAFRGLSKKRCKSIEFIDREPMSRRQEKLQKSLDRALRGGNVSWITMRVADNGNVRCDKP
jgi:predicted Holliday junction resolvase-like endonuclease